MDRQNFRNIILALFAGIFLAFLFETTNQNKIDLSTKDTLNVIPLVYVECPEVVLNKKALLVGDSHSAFVRGWQTFLSDWTGLEIVNTAVEGKTTSWMKVKLVQNIDSTFDYCFIFGGGNDAASSIPPQEIFKNIEQMVDICLEFGVKPVVILGTSTDKVLKSNSNKWNEYARIKTEYQNLLETSLDGSKIIDTRDLIERSDCADFLCHMQISGHKKVAEKVIQDLNLYQIVEN
jgi:hypothetical protein